MASKSDVSGGDQPTVPFRMTAAARPEADPVPLLDLARENGPLQAEIQAAIADVCGSGAFVLGPECKRLESSIAELSGTRHGVGCASGSDALLLALIGAQRRMR